MHEGEGLTTGFYYCLIVFSSASLCKYKKFPTPLSNNISHIENDKTIREVTQLVHLSYYYPLTYRLNPYRIEQGY